MRQPLGQEAVTYEILADAEENEQSEDANDERHDCGDLSEGVTTELRHEGG